MNEQRKRERTIADLNKQRRYAESLKLYLDARCPCEEVWNAYQGLVKENARLRSQLDIANHGGRDALDMD